MFLGFFAWYAGLARGGVARIGQVQLAQPVLTLGWSAALLGEQVERGHGARPRWPCWPASRRRSARAEDGYPFGRMAVNTNAVGKTYPPLTYAVGREKIREYALAVGETNPLHLDVEAARAAGYRDVVAPPMFAVVYSSPGAGPGDLRPRGGDQLRADGPRRARSSSGGRWSSPATRSRPR